MGCTEADGTGDELVCPGSPGCPCQFDFDCQSLGLTCNAGRCLDADANVDPLDTTTAGDGATDGEEDTDSTTSLPEIDETDDPDLETEAEDSDADVEIPPEGFDADAEVEPDEEDEVDLAEDTTEVVQAPMEDHWIAYSQTITTILTELYFIQSDGEGRVLYQHDPVDTWVKHPAWSRDGTRLALNVANDEGFSIRVIDFENETWHDYQPGLDLPSHPAWFPDGERILVSAEEEGSDNNTLWVLDLTADTLIGADPFIADSGLNDNMSRVSADGTTVVLKRGVASSDFRLYEWSAADGVSRIDHIPDLGPGSFDWSLDDSRLIYSTAASAVFSVALDGRGRMSYSASNWVLDSGRASGAQNPAFFPEGRRFIVAATTPGHPELVIVNAETGDLILQLTDDDKQQLEAAVSPALATDIDITALERLVELE